jgi:two-component system, response regulator PdtaR
MAMAPTILIVEDERMIAEYFKVIVEHLGYPVCGIAGTADEAVRLAREKDPDIVFMDVRLEGKKDGVDAAKEICAHKSVPMVFITASREPATVNRINTDHPAAILIKPVLQDHLREVLTRLCPP